MLAVQSHAHRPWHLSAVFAIAAALRLAVFAFTTLPSVLETRPELSTPITSFRSLREGVFIHAGGMNPYAGGVFHHSPLYLGWFSVILPASSYTLTALFWTIVDLVGALALVALWSARSVRPESRKSLVALLYLFNPYTLMTCFSRSTTSIDGTLLVLAISLAANGCAVQAGALLSFAAHTSLYPILVLPAMCMETRRHRASLGRSGEIRSALVGFVVGAGSLATVNQLLFGSSWLKRTWLVILGVSDLTPNVGMWWYFVTEMFDHFRPFFLGVFHLHNVIYVAPICLRMRHDPVLAMVIITGVFSTWKSYPALGDLGVWAGLVGCFPEVIANLRHPLFTLTVYLYTLLLLPMLHSLWLLTGTGNANFFYAATMVHGLNSSLAIVDIVGAAIRSDIQASVRAEAQEIDGKGMRVDLEREEWQIIQLNKVE